MDIGLPFYNGYYWCQEIRKVSSLPVIFLSSASDNMNIIMAMNMGGDDFIAKPFDLTVLIAKIQAMLRRAYDFGGSLPVLEHRGGHALHRGPYPDLRGGQAGAFKNEYGILLTLMENKGQSRQPGEAYGAAVGNGQLRG